MAYGTIPPGSGGTSGGVEWGRPDGEVEGGRAPLAHTPRDPLRVVAVAGSLRRSSYNRSLLRAAQGLRPAQLLLEIHHLDGIPLFNEDVERDEIPPAVAHLRDAVAGADGFLVATPEYNRGVPGVMKNAFDWLSRPAGESVLEGKPAGIMGATPGSSGTAYAQSELRRLFAFTDTPVMMRPEVLVARAQKKFDAEGRLTDAPTRAVVTAFLEQFAAWIVRHDAGRAAHV